MMHCIFIRILVINYRNYSTCNNVILSMHIFENNVLSAYQGLNLEGRICSILVFTIVLLYNRPDPYLRFLYKNRHET